MIDQVAALIEHINATLGTRYRLVERFASGEQGAFALEDEHGEQMVLKWRPGADCVQRYSQQRHLTERLRSTGYPVPSYLHIGTDGNVSYAIQSAIPGSPPQQLAPVHIKRLIDLNRLQRHASNEPNNDWITQIRQSVLEGFEAYCVVDSLRSWSAQTADLLDHVQNIVAGWQPDDAAPDDIVHFDFHTMNILIRGDEVTGIVDWDGVNTGNCVFDLVTLVFYQQSNILVRDLLWEEIVLRADPAEVGSYIAHMTVRQVDWMIRYYDSAAVDHFVDVARRTLTECEQRFA